MIYRNSNLQILPEMKMADVIIGSPYFTLMLDHFGIELEVHEKTVAHVCGENNIRPELFIAFADLVSGYKNDVAADLSVDDVKVIISYLKNSHQYYREEKYPQISAYISQMFEINSHAGVMMVDRFFNDYFREVREHLDYENNVVFPYVMGLYDKISRPGNVKVMGRSLASEYRDHHNNVEEKLADLTNLLIRYLPPKNDRTVRRKLLLSLFELGHDLSVHSRIEDHILVPLTGKMEELIMKEKYE